MCRLSGCSGVSDEEETETFFVNPFIDPLDCCSGVSDEEETETLPTKNEIPLNEGLQRRLR